MSQIGQQDDALLGEKTTFLSSSQVQTTFVAAKLFNLSATSVVIKVPLAGNLRVVR